VREASRLASDYMALLESIGDSTLTVGLSFGAIFAKAQAGELADALRWSQTVIGLASGDPAEGSFLAGSPLAGDVGVARHRAIVDGLPEWRDDFDRAVAIARGIDPVSYAFVINGKYGPSITNGLLLADDFALREIEQALRIAERSADNIALGNADWCTGLHWSIETPPTASAAWRYWRMSAACAFMTGSTWANCRPSMCSWRGRGPGGATAKVPCR
jgi:hypothetical protein